MMFDLPRAAAAAALVALAISFAAAGRPAFAADDPKLEVGKPAPDVDLPATQAEKVLPDQKDAKTLHLKDLRGKKNVVLYFFPKAMTAG